MPFLTTVKAKCEDKGHVAKLYKVEIPCALKPRDS